ncbi:hypothetical protein J7M28_03155 [bacterium]|nr:hypothetical protein [bacterium]
MRKKRRIPFADIARRITGISTPVFGVSWNPAEDKREIVRRLVAFLEDRRALYADFHMEYGPWVENSVLEMRAELTSILKACSEDEELVGPIRAMRAACRKFLDQTGHPGSPRRMLYPHEAAMWHSLGEMRGIFGLHLARLCSAYGVDVEPELASIFPKADEEVAE